MKKYKILNGAWDDLEHTRAAVTVEVQEDGKEPYTTLYGISSDDDAEMNKDLLKIIKEDQAKQKPSINMRENHERQMLAGIIPVPSGRRIVERDGIKTLVNDVDEKARMTLRVRERLDKLYSGFEQAMAERSPKRAENRKRKIDALLAAETLPDWPYVDLTWIEEKS